MPEYPKYLHHPSYAPADLDVMGQGAERPRGVAATRYPPVVVHNADQEAEYVQRRGYSPGAYSQSNIDQMQVAPKPSGYREQPYPMYGQNGEVIEDPNRADPGIDPREYPKYVGDVIVRSPEEERRAMVDAGLPDPMRVEYEAAIKRATELGKRLGLEEIDPDAMVHLSELSGTRFEKGSPTAFRELADQFEVERKARAANANPNAPAAAHKAKPAMPNRQRGIPLAPRKPPITFRNSPEQIELLELCIEAGLKVDNRYGIARLREMLEEATAPTQVEEPAHAQQDS